MKSNATDSYAFSEAKLDDAFKFIKIENVATINLNSGCSNNYYNKLIKQLKIESLLFKESYDSSKTIVEGGLYVIEFIKEGNYNILDIKRHTLANNVEPELKEVNSFLQFVSSCLLPSS
jgi:hypothetical protein